MDVLHHMPENLTKLPTRWPGVWVCPK